MKFLLYILAMLITFYAGGQNNTVIAGKVSDKDNNEPIPNCLVKIQGKNILAKTDDQGNFELVCKECDSSSIILFSAFNYLEESRIMANGKSVGKNKVTFNIEMKFSSYLLNTINISTLPDTVWGDSLLNVADFAFVKGNLLLLTYKNELRWKKQNESKKTLYEHCQLILLDTQYNEISRTDVPGIALKLNTQYLGEVFLEGRNNLYYIYFQDGKMSLEDIALKEFEDNYQPVVDTSGAFTYFSNYNKDYPEFFYMMNEKGDSSIFKFRKVIDEKMMEIFRSEYKYLDPRDKLEAFRFELKTGIDKEIVGAYMSGFQNSVYYEPLNVPLFLSDDTLTMFDHHHNQIIRFDKSGIELDSCDIRYHIVPRPGKWGEKVILDEQKKYYYTWFSQNRRTDVVQIDPHNGSTGKATRLSFQDAECIRINNGWVYYVYRPFESLQNKYLYRERLPESGR